MHGEEEESRCWLADIVYIQKLRHGAGHGQLQEKNAKTEKDKGKEYTDIGSKEYNDI